MSAKPPTGGDPTPPTTFPAGWYPDPWKVAPWRWWDGRQWTPGLYGPYGEAWPTRADPSVKFQPKGPGIKGGGIAAVGAGLGVVGSSVVAVAILVAFNGTVTGVDHSWYLLASEVPLWLAFLGSALVASRMNGTGSLKADFGLTWPRWRDLWSGMAGGVIGRLWPLLFLLLDLVASHESLSRPNPTAPQVLGSTPVGVSGWLLIAVVTVVGAPFFEELFFRGLIQGAFTRRVGAVPAIFVSALIFSFVHVTDEGLLAPLILFPMALILGYLKHRTGRLAPGMVAHATFNATLLLLFLVPAFR